MVCESLMDKIGWQTMKYTQNTIPNACLQGSVNACQVCSQSVPWMYLTLRESFGHTPRTQSTKSAYSPVREVWGEKALKAARSLLEPSRKPGLFGFGLWMPAGLGRPFVEGSFGFTIFKVSSAGNRNRIDDYKSDFRDRGIAENLEEIAQDLRI